MLLSPRVATSQSVSAKYGCFYFFARNFFILHFLTLQVVFILKTIELPTLWYCRTSRSPLACTIRCTLVQLISTHVVSFISVLFRYRQTRRPHHDLNTILPISSRHSPLSLSFVFLYISPIWRETALPPGGPTPVLHPGAFLA